MDKKAEIKIPVNIGDTILMGRFKNKRVVVKEIGIDNFGQPTINGKPILKIRIEHNPMHGDAMEKLRNIVSSVVKEAVF